MLISIIFLPIQGWNLYLVISLIFGFLFGILNEITSHLIKLTKDIKDDEDDEDDDKTELIKG